MSQLSTLPAGAIITLEDAERALDSPEDFAAALATIVVAESAERLFARAKNAAGVAKAIRIKLLNQAVYARDRQISVIQGRHISALKYEKPDLDPGAVVIHRWRKRLCSKDAETGQWRIDGPRFEGAADEITSRAVRICEQEKDGTIRGTEGTGEFERYTPAEYIEKAREVMGGIDLDPASCERAQKTVAATTFFTVEDDGLARQWHGRVWLNPPYHRDLAPRFIDKLIDEYEAKRIDQAIVLTNNSTDTSWFQSAALICDTICFTQGRIHFEVPNGDPVSPTQGQAFFYFGHDTKRFVSVFETVGVCMGLA